MFTGKQKERLGTASATHRFTATNCTCSHYLLPVTTSALGQGIAMTLLKGKKCLFRNIRNKRKTRQNMGPLRKDRGDLAVQDMEKAVRYSMAFLLQLGEEKAPGRRVSSLPVPEGSYKRAGEGLATRACSDRTRGPLS